MSVSDLIVRRLIDWGVTRIYGYSGDGNNTLLGAIRRAGENLDFIAARHEEGAAFMAVGDAKYSRTVGVVTATQGPGAVHLLNGLYDAKLDSAPVVALVAQQSRSVLGSDYQQEIDLHNLFSDVATPFMETVTTPEQLPMVLDRAFRAALANSGPAVVIIPHDIQQEPEPELGQEHGEMVTAVHWSSGHLVPRDEDLAQAVKVLTEGKKVAILAGRGVQDAQEELLELAELLGAGITTALLGKPFVDETHRLAAGNMGHLGTHSANWVLQNCDTLLIIGANSPWTEFYPPPGQARAVQIDVNAATLGNRYPIEVGLLGQSAPTIMLLLEHLSRHLPAEKDEERSTWETTVEEAIANSRTISRDRSLVPAHPLNPELVMSKVNDLLWDDTQLAIDVGSSVYHYVRHINVPRGAAAHLSSTLASMGCGIPYGISAKEVSPERPVVVLAGDGAMTMLGINELITVADRWRSWADPRFVVVVLANRDLSEVSWEQRETEGEPRFEASQRVPAFDFVAFAEQLGLRGVRADDPDGLDGVLEQAFTADRPIIIEAHTDPDIPLIPPYPHGRELVKSMREGITAEGAAGEHALRLLETYAEIEERYS